MSVLHIHTAEEYKTQVLEADMPVLVDFWAAWCGPCKMIAPELEAVAQDYEGKARVVKVDVDENGSVAMSYNVMSIPTILVIKDGKEIDRQVGFCPRSKLAAMLDGALG